MITLPMNSALSILLIEDDVVDVMAVKRAFRDLSIINPLIISSNGEEGLSRLRAEELPLPGLILLDLNMPRMNGIDFLRTIKQDSRLRRLPVVVLTTSKEDKDRLESFDLSVAGYMIKPVDYAKFVDVIRTIQLYWTLSELPPAMECAS
jgi:CheY-like chemotaxis protein